MALADISELLQVDDKRVAECQTFLSSIKQPQRQRQKDLVRNYRPIVPEPINESTKLLLQFTINGPHCTYTLNQLSLTCQEVDN